MLNKHCWNSIPQQCLFHRSQTDDSTQRPALVTLMKRFRGPGPIVAAFITLITPLLVEMYSLPAHTTFKSIVLPCPAEGRIDSSATIILYRIPALYIRFHPSCIVKKSPHHQLSSVHVAEICVSLAYMPNEQFASQLKLLRKERGMTVRGLASASGLSPVWITLVENGHQQIGLNALMKLSKGLGLSGDLEDEFLMKGLNNNHLLPKCSQYGAQLNNAVALLLNRSGITAATISAVSSTHEGEIAVSDLEQQETKTMNQTNHSTTLWLTMENRQVAAVQIRLYTATTPDRASEDALFTPQARNMASADKLVNHYEESY